MRKIISILESEKYTNEDVKELQEILIGYLDKEEHYIISAAGESENAVWRLLKKFAVWYPGDVFGFYPSSSELLDKLIKEGRFDTDACELLTFDIRLIGMNETLAKKTRDLHVLKNADVVILPKTCTQKLKLIKKSDICAETVLI